MTMYYYVTYDPTSATPRTLTGNGLGDTDTCAEPTGSGYFDVSSDVCNNWCNYQMNATFDGLELVPPPSLAENQVWQAMRDHVGGVAMNTFGYASVLDAILFADSTDAQFQSDALALKAYRANCYSTIRQFIVDVRAGTRTMPSATADIVAMLPTAPTPDPSYPALAPLS